MAECGAHRPRGERSRSLSGTAPGGEAWAVLREWGKLDLRLLFHPPLGCGIPTTAFLCLSPDACGLGHVCDPWSPHLRGP